MPDINWAEYFVKHCERQLREYEHTRDFFIVWALPSVVHWESHRTYRDNDDFQMQAIRTLCRRAYDTALPFAEKMSLAHAQELRDNVSALQAETAIRIVEQKLKGESTQAANRAFSTLTILERALEAIMEEFVEKFTTIVSNALTYDRWIPERDLRNMVFRSPHKTLLDKP